MPVSSADVAAAALAQLDVHFGTWARPVSGVRLAKRPVSLIASLAQHDEARLRLSIIPLLFRHPEFAAAVPDATRRLSPSWRNALEMYYTAALLLQQKYAARLEIFLGRSDPLPDLYSRELGIPAPGEPDTRLRMLARKQRERSRLALNWLGTYEHAADRYVRHLEFVRH